MIEEGFLPADFKGIPGGGGYLKFIEGDNKFRILSRPVIGWEYWTEVEGKRKPNRVKEFGDIPRDYQIKTGKEAPKYFWAMVVWDYVDQEVKILSITQKSILNALQVLIDDSDWGTPLNYDLTVKKSGSGLETEYMTNPKPKKELPIEIKTIYEDMNIDLQAWLRSEDPFKQTQSSTEGLEVMTDEEMSQLENDLNDL